MKTRKEVVKFLDNRKFSTTTIFSSKRSRSHFGKQELKMLMDFIYEGEPQSDDEKLGDGVSV